MIIDWMIIITMIITYNYHQVNSWLIVVGNIIMVGSIWDYNNDQHNKVKLLSLWYNNDQHNKVQSWSSMVIIELMINYEYNQQHDPQWLLLTEWSITIITNISWIIIIDWMMNCNQHDTQLLLLLIVWWITIIITLWIIIINTMNYNYNQHN